MNQLNNLSKLKEASFFGKETLQRVVNVSDNALYTNMKRWIKKGEMVQFKKGLYTTKSYIVSVVEKQTYREYIANILKQPSYISCEYVLQKYGMLTESVFAITSVALKKTGKYQNILGTYSYSKIKPELFTGFTINSVNGYDIKEATKPKALFDFLYYRLWRKPEITKPYVESFRLNFDEFDRKNVAEFDTYVQLTKITKLKVLTDIIGKLTYDRK